MKANLKVKCTQFFIFLRTKRAHSSTPEHTRARPSTKFAHPSTKHTQTQSSTSPHAEHKNGGVRRKFDEACVDVLDCVWVCFVLRCANFVRGCAWVCSGVLGCARVCLGVMGCARVCLGVLGCACVCLCVPSPPPRNLIVPKGWPYRLLLGQLTRACWFGRRWSYCQVS